MRQLPPLPEETTVQACLNRRRCCAMHRAYPPALVVSTLIAALFCYLYLTKPVVQVTTVSPKQAPTVTPATPGPLQPPEVAKIPPAAAPEASAAKPLLHSGKQLPGDPATTALVPTPPATPPKPATPSEFGPGYEETNVRIQHALNAEGPDGELGRILLEVPVLYQSRRLRWTPTQVAEARQLFERLRVHQENIRSVRVEGTSLLAAWNNLIERSIPDDALRADSPSLPVNQAGGHRGPSPAGLDTSETIRVSSSESP